MHKSWDQQVKEWPIIIQLQCHLQSSPALHSEKVTTDVGPELAVTDEGGCPADSTVQTAAVSAVGPGVQPAFLQPKKAELHACGFQPSATQEAEEVSFEELRAAKWLAQHANKVGHVRTC